jgi:hypothetical protein
VIENGHVDGEMRGRHVVIVSEYVTSGFEVNNKVRHSCMCKVCYRAKATVQAFESPWDFAGDFPGFQGNGFLSVNAKIFFHIF